MLITAVYVPKMPAEPEHKKTSVYSPPARLLNLKSQVGSFEVLNSLALSRGKEGCSKGDDKRQ